MRKIIAFLLATLMLLSLAACGGTQTPGTTDDSGKTPGNDSASTQTEAGFALTFSDVKLVPGAAFDAKALPEADTVTQVPSCAFQGTDNAYNYGTFELTAYNEGKGEIIYSIYLLDPNTATDEGLYLGDDLARAKELYGTEFTQNGTQVTYTRGKTLLNLILQDDSIISIELRMAQ